MPSAALPDSAHPGHRRTGGRSPSQGRVPQPRWCSPRIPAGPTSRSTSTTPGCAGPVSRSRRSTARWSATARWCRPSPWRPTAAGSILARGSRLVHGSRALLALFAATFLVNGAAGAFGRLHPVRLVAFAPGADPVVWLTGLGVLTCLAGAATPRLDQPRNAGPGAVRRGYLGACAVAAAGAFGVALARGATSSSLAVLVATAALPLTRAFGTIWVNGRTVGAVRATVHSMPVQAEYAGTIVCGLTVSFTAERAGTRTALATCAALIILAVIAVQGVDKRES